MRVAILSAAALSLAMSLTLAACSQPTEKAPDAAKAEPRALAGVDLDQPVRVLGNEPFWTVEIKSDGLIYSGLDRAEQKAANPGPTLQGNLASWAAKTEAGNDLAITLTATDCSDGMSDRTYPLTAKVEIGGETLTGCAAATAAIERAGESGRVE
ncbi:COG3650 family protein [Brevundimonas diminuta]|uniref:COG3650 family protein n=1 Tax=Brevundimonas diminuta TaxID=293 RepID=UPI003D04095C